MKQIGAGRLIVLQFCGNSPFLAAGKGSVMQQATAIKRWMIVLAVIILMISTLSMAQGNTAGESGGVRVLLSNLGLTDSLKIGIYGSYSIENHITFQRGAELQIRLSPQGITLFYEGMTYFPGSRLILKRHQAQAGLENGLRLQDGLNLYTGDLHLSAAGGALQAVLLAPVEEYLMGVVPYEMSDDFPLEALKAQAIAARTYTLRNLKPTQAYDLTDTTNDQVYYGLNAEKINAIKAVRETEGITCFFQNALAQCYYTASNGGFTESALNAWGRESIPYLGIIEDRYDRENPRSEVRSASLPRNITDQTTQLNPAMLKLLMDKLQPRLEDLGYSPDAAHIRIDEIVDIVPHTTRFGGEHGVMRFVRFDLKVSGRSLGRADQEVSFTVEGNATQAPQAQLSGFSSLPQPISADIEIFPALEAALNLSINRNPNELVHVEKSQTAFRISFTRYGHGVGMSQRGAEWMAAIHGWDYQKILRFYYPGTELMKVDTAFPMPDPIGTAYLTTPGPVPTATPRPTLMPVEESKATGKQIVIVTKIPVNSSLNLRSEASLNSEVIMRLHFGQELVVLEQQEDGWLLVQTDVAKGYVREEFVSIE